MFDVPHAQTFSCRAPFGPPGHASPEGAAAKDYARQDTGCPSSGQIGYVNAEKLQKDEPSLFVFSARCDLLSRPPVYLENLFRLDQVTREARSRAWVLLSGQASAVGKEASFVMGK